MQAKLAEILKLAEIAADSLASGLSVLEVRITQQGKRRCLEVTIHRRGGRINLDDCEGVSRALDQLLEKEPLVDGSYLLEVQSPGLDRQIKTARDLAAFTGESVTVKTKECLESLGWEFSGILKGFDDQQIEIAYPKPLQAPSKKNQTAVALPETIFLALSKIAQIQRQIESSASMTTADSQEEPFLTIE